MSDPYLGQLMLGGFGFAPVDYSLCNGQLLPVSDNAALFSLLGIQFGGDGRTEFALPDLRGRAPVGPGNYGVVQQGQFGGFETVTLVQSQIPHTHAMQAYDGDGDYHLPYLTGRTMALAKTVTAGQGSAAAAFAYGPEGNLTAIGNGAVSSFGGGGAHANIQPSLGITFMIAMDGTYPPRN